MEFNNQAPAGYTFIRDRSSEDRLDMLINTLQFNLYKSEPKISIAVIQLSLDIRYTLAKRIFQRLKASGKLDDENRLIYKPHHLNPSQDSNLLLNRNIIKRRAPIKGLRKHRFRQRKSTRWQYR